MSVSPAFRLKLPANVFIFLLLCLLKRVVLIAEVRTGVGHAVIKPQLIEVIPAIVMVGDVFCRTRKRVEGCLAQVFDGKFGFQSDRQIEERVVRSESEQLCEIALDLNTSCHILFAEAQRPAFEHMFCRLLCGHGENELWFPGAVRFFDPIPKLHMKRHVPCMIAQRFEELLECFSHDLPLPSDRTCV